MDLVNNGLEFTIPLKMVPHHRTKHDRELLWRSRQFQSFVAERARESMAAKGIKTTWESVRAEIKINGGRNGDTDNFTKNLLDALNRVYYNDDSQVVELHIFLSRLSPKEYRHHGAIIHLSIIPPVPPFNIS